MRNKWLNSLLGLLVVIAVVLGLLLYKQAALFTKSQHPATTPSTTPSANRAKQQVATASAKRALTTDEKAALTPPGPNASEDDRTKFAQLIGKLANPAGVLDLSQCVATPTVFRTKYGGTFTVVNHDTVNHKMIVDRDHIFDIAANGQTQVKADFGKAAGIYGYGCDSSSGAVGMILAD